MFRLRTKYGFVVIVSAVILSITGLLKLYEFANDDITGTSWLLPIGVIELMLAAWLLTGVGARWARLSALGFFLVTFNVALGRAIEGYPSCGCFGRIEVAPWYMVALDATFLVAFGIAYPSTNTAQEQGTARTGKSTLKVAFVVGTVVLLAGASFGIREWRNRQRIGARLAPQEIAWLSEVRQSIETNHTRYRSLAFRVTRTIRNPSIEKEESITESNSTSKTTVVRKPEFREEFRYFVRNDDVRRETISGIVPGRIETIFRGRQVQIHPATRQAWVFTEETTAQLAEPLDPRCLGFRTPLLRLGNWFDRVKITRVAAYSDFGTEGIVVNGLTRSGTTVTAYFSARHAFLPVRVQESWDSNENYLVAEITLRKVPGTDAWFPQQVMVRKASNGEHGSTARPHLEYSVIGDFEVNLDTPNELFDQPLPREFHVLDTSGTSVAKETTSDRTSISELFQQVPKRTRHSWLYVVVADLVFVGLWIVFRNRLRL